MIKKIDNRSHIKKLHQNDQYIPPLSPSMDYYNEVEVVEESDSIIKEKKKYPRKVGSFECDLCGRILKSNRSLSQHLLLHSKIYQYVCEVKLLLHLTFFFISLLKNIFF